MSKFRQCPERKKGAKKDHTRHGKSLSRITLAHQGMPKKYNVNAKCEYHGGVGGHSEENCTAFKDKVQSLINADPVKFEGLVNGHQKH